MCCEICPRYTACEEEGHLNDLCCASCADCRSCHEEGAAKSKGEDALTDEFENV